MMWTGEDRDADDPDQDREQLGGDTDQDISALGSDLASLARAFGVRYIPPVPVQRQDDSQ
jgi:hypothetical protein